MNFIKFLIIILMFSFAKPQSIATSVNIKPIVEIPSNGQVRFIGFEGEGLYKKASLYEITNKKTLKKLPQFKIGLQEQNTTYLIDGHLGDVSGEGQEDLILIFNDPNKGTTIYGWTLEKNGKFIPFDKPTLLSKQQKLSQPTSSKLVKLYPDKDKELIITFGSPDRKAVIVDYVNAIQQTEEIGERFLSNLAGPILMETGDFNQDGLEDIFLLNNGEEKLSTTYLSPERSPIKTKLPFSQAVLDLYCYEKKPQDFDKLFLLKDGSIYVESWNKIIPTKISQPKEIALYKKNIISIINKKGVITHLEINEKEKKIISKNTVTPLFKNKKYTDINFLILQDEENMIISHNEKSEIIYQPLYFNQMAEPEIAEPEIVERELKTTPTIKNNIIKEKETTLSETKKTTAKKPGKIKKEVPLDIKTVFLGRADTVVVSVGEKTEIKLNLNKEYNFIDLMAEKQPKKMNFDTNSLVFYWVPEEKNIGNNALQYSITYLVNKGIKKNNNNGKIVLQNETEEIKENKNYVIYVNDPPRIILEEKTHTVQANNKITIPIVVVDKNTDQKIKVPHDFLNDKQATFNKQIFSWVPNKKDYGEHSIVFTADDGVETFTATAIIMVDTLKQEIVKDKLLITSVNKELIYDLEKKPPTKFSKIKTPSNLRISKEGLVHWIPIETQLGLNEIIVEATENKEGFRFNFQVYVNSPPIISYTPDKIEYITKNEEYIFQLQSFDRNEEQKLFWSLQTKTPLLLLNSQAELKFKGKGLDFFDYEIQLTDTIDVDFFRGKFYINDKPRIISVPPKHISLGDVLEYFIEVADSNKTNPLNQREEKHIKTSIINAPKGMDISNQKLTWKPQEQDVGSHKIKIKASDGLEEAEQSFTLFVNDSPSIITVDSIAIKLGDTLRHTLTAKDLNKKTDLTYSIQSGLEGMILNISTGEIVWKPQREHLGKHVIEANVSDGFDSRKAGKKIKILVYDFPKFLNTPAREAYVDIEYKHMIEAEDALGKTIKNKDIFVSLKKTTFEKLSFDESQHLISIVPQKEEIGTQSIEMHLKDKHGYLLEKKFFIKVLMSPCETIDTLYIETKSTKIEEKIKEIEKKQPEKKEAQQKNKQEKKNLNQPPKSTRGIKTKGFNIPGTKEIKKKKQKD